MANTNPPVDSAEVLSDILTRGKKERIHICSAANVTKGMQGKTVNDLEALKAAGAVVFTDDGKPILDEETFRKALQKAKELGIPVSLHEEDPAYIKENGIHGAGEAAKQLGIGGSDRMAEISMVERDTRIAAELGAKLLIQHISTAEGVELVRRAKAKNPGIAAEATPHHFSLTEHAVLEKGSQAKVNPPLRTQEDRMAIIRGMQDGTIDIIATDHAPHSREEKAVVPLWKAPSGMIGLETALSLALKNLVEPGYLTMSEMLAMLTYKPADYYGLPAGRLEKGACADIVIFDPKEEWMVTEESFHSKSCNSPFIGEPLPGVVRYTIAGGQLAYTRS
jgi:dihydroorotase